ncbi:MAG: hypothetical protein IPL53_18565 [Ignavibacteria bacterium]|nr:hypothetical protein [Ignavibacteria bacterium]
MAGFLQRHANGLFVTAPGLDYAGYQLPGIGNATSLVNTGQDSYSAFF